MLPRTDIGAKLNSEYCGSVSWTAAGTGDNTAVTGLAIDRLGYNSAKAVIGYTTTLTEAKTLSFAVEITSCATSGGTYDTATALQAATVAATGDTGGSTETGTLEFDIDLSGYKRYIKINFTPDLSHTGTDTARAMAIAILGGKDTNPATGA